MSNKYQNQICVYCGEEKAEEGDHVIARQFIPVEKRAYLPKVPSCKKCNNAKSELEHYLTTVLPFGSNAPEAEEMLSKMVPPRLEKNLKLKSTLQEEARKIWVKYSGSEILQKTMTLPIEGQKLIELSRMIIKGLAVYHWQVLIPKDYIVEVHSVTLEGLVSFRDNVETLFYNEDSVKGNIGNGCFLYVGAKHFALPTLSCWEMSFYNVHLTGSGKNANGSLYFCGLIRPSKPISKEDLSLRNI